MAIGSAYPPWLLTWHLTLENTIMPNILGNLKSPLQELEKLTHLLLVMSREAHCEDDNWLCLTSLALHLAHYFRKFYQPKLY